MLGGFGVGIKDGQGQGTAAALAGSLVATEKELDSARSAERVVRKAYAAAERNIAEASSSIAVCPSPVLTNVMPHLSSSDLQGANFVNILIARPKYIHIPGRRGLAVGFMVRHWRLP